MAKTLSFDALGKAAKGEWERTMFPRGAPPPPIDLETDTFLAPPCP